LHVHSVLSGSPGGIILNFANRGYNDKTNVMVVVVVVLYIIISGSIPQNHYKYSSSFNNSSIFSIGLVVAVVIGAREPLF